MRQFQTLVKNDLKKEHLKIHDYLGCLFTNATVKKNGLGQGLFKVRVARKGQGKSGGFRDIIFWEDGTHSIAVYQFAKGDSENINDEQLAYFKELADNFKKLTEDDVSKLLAENFFLEYKDGTKDKKKK